MGRRHKTCKKRKNTQNKPDAEPSSSADSCPPSYNYYDYHFHNVDYRIKREPVAANGGIDIDSILNILLEILSCVSKFAWKILCFLYAAFKFLLFILLALLVIVFGLLTVVFIAFNGVVQCLTYLEDYLPEQFVRPFQVIAKVILTVVPPVFRPVARYIIAPILHFTTGDQQFYDEIVNSLNEVNQEPTGFEFIHGGHGNVNLDADYDVSDEDEAGFENGELDFDIDPTLEDGPDAESDIESEASEFDCFPHCGGHSFHDIEDNTESCVDSDSSDGSSPDLFNNFTVEPDMDLLDNLVTDQTLKDFKDVWMHPECGLRIQSVVRLENGQIMQFSYCINDKFGDRVVFKNQGDAKNSYVKFKPCAVLHAPPPRRSLEEPLWCMARPPDIPNVMQHARSYDAHLRYHGIEQLYLLFLRHDLRGILMELGLAEVCFDTMARKHADSRTRHLCSLMVKECLDNDVLFDITDNFSRSLSERSPVEYLKRGPAKLKKLLAPHKLRQQSASEKYAVAYKLWSSSIEKVMALPWKEQLPLPYKKNMIKTLAEGIRVCKMGSTAAAKAKHYSKDDPKNPAHIFAKMAADVLVETTENLDAHLVACVCEELKRDFEEAVTKADAALVFFPSDPWLLVLRAQSSKMIKCCDRGDEHVINAMILAWRGFQKEGIFTMECYETFLRSLYNESQYSLAYDVALEAVENVPIDDERYSNVALLLAILHLADLYHPDKTDRLDPVDGFVKYFKIARQAEEIYKEIWEGMRARRFGRQADMTAEYLKKFMMFPIEMRTLMNNVPYYCHKIRTNNIGNIDGRMKQCNVCGIPEVEKPLRKCSRCRGVHYCSVGCQQTDWPVHRMRCKKE